MTSASPLPRYNGVAIAFHWIVALLILFQLGLGLTMANLMEPGPDLFQAITLHKSIGVTILILAALRLLWRLFNAPPPLPADMPRWQVGVAHATHWLLYLSFFILPISGWLMSSAFGRPVSVFGFFTLPDFVAKDKALAEQLAQVHMISAYVLLALVVIHIGAALQHFLIKRDEILARMLPLAKWS